MVKYTVSVVPVKLLVGVFEYEYICDRLLGAAAGNPYNIFISKSGILLSI